MKKIILTIISILCIINVSYAYVEDLVFCTIKSDSITITIKKEKNYKCTEYLNVLSQTINTEYNDILSAQNLINKGYDKDFWTEIRDTKIEKVKKLVSTKEQIEKAMKEFDNNLFIKIKDYLTYTLSPERTDFQAILKAIKANQKKWVILTNNEKQKLNQMEEAIGLINTIMTTSDFDTLIKSFNKYIYLKKQIIWK